MSVTQEAKIAIATRQLTIAENTLYEFEVRLRVAGKVNDKDLKKQITEQMVKYEKMKDEYELVLKELEKG